MKKKIINTTLMVAALSATGVSHALEFSGNVTLASDYVFRGISQNSNNMALQGGLDANFSNGFYLGVWGSNVDFDSTGIEGESLELDWYAGYSAEITKDVSYDVGIMYYDYPGSQKKTGYSDGGSSNPEYTELYGILSFGDFTVGLAWSDDYWLESGEFYYIYGEYSVDLGSDYALTIHVGQNELDYSSGDSDIDDAEHAFLSDDEDDYLDWSIGITKEFMGVEVGLTYTDTNLDDEECFDDDNICADTYILSFTKSL